MPVAAEARTQLNNVLCEMWVAEWGRRALVVALCR